MKQVSLWRPVSIVVVFLVCAYYFFPTARYLAALSRPKPQDEAQLQAWNQRLEDLRQKAIPLGLDLRGGVDVTLTIDQDEAATKTVRDLVTTLNNEFRNQNISASAWQADDGMHMMVKAIDKGEARQIFNTLKNYEEQFTGDFSQEEIERQDEIRLGVNERIFEQRLYDDIRGAEKVVRDRLDKFGLAQPSISIEGQSRIRIQVAGETDPDRLIKNLTTLATMEFRLTHEQYGTPSDPINQLLDEKGELKPDSMIPLGYEVLPYKFGRVDKKTNQITYNEGKLLVHQAAELTGNNLRSASVVQDPFDLENPVKVSIQFDQHGADVFAKITSESADRFRDEAQANHLAVVLDGVVITSPEMKVPITGGNAVIEGGYQLEDARDLALLLKAGSLPAPLKVESQNTVGASLGTQSIFGGVRALTWGALAVIIFMCIYYGTAGVIAVIALTLNVLIIFAIMAMAGATLTLSGIGGILLTIGMAVDANVLIYERIREEVEAGRPMRQAIGVGFDRAFSVIFDSNLTSLLTALVLLQFTEGTVFGFALTMAFGLLANLYTGLTVTYTLCALWFQWRGSLNVGKLRIFHNTKFDFIKFRWVSLSLSGVLLLVGLGLVVARGGFQMGVDFAGGLLSEVTFSQPTSEDEIRSALTSAGFGGQRVQSITGTNSYQIRVKELESAASAAASTEAKVEGAQKLLTDALASKFGPEGFKIETFRTVGPETGQQFYKMAIMVVLLAGAAILIYVWVRFEWIFGLAAVLTLIHDLCITTFWVQAWGTEITLDVVASLMVLLGFSVNDTIVLFDRIREIARKNPAMPFRDLCNLAMNQTLGRTVITSGTVFLVITTMLVIGGEGLNPFARVMFIGVIAGSYSTAFFAAPIVFLYNQWKKNRVLQALTEKKTTGPESAKDPRAQRTTGGSVPKRRAV